MIELLVLADELFDYTKPVNYSKRRRKIRKEEMAAHIIASRWDGGAPVDISQLFAPEIGSGLIKFVWMKQSAGAPFAVTVDNTETGLAFKFNRELSKPDFRFAMAYAVARLYCETNKAHESISFVRLDNADRSSLAYKFAVDLIVPRGSYLSAVNMLFDKNWRDKLKRAFGFGTKSPNYFQALLDFFGVPEHVMRYRVYEKKLENLG